MPIRLVKPQHEFKSRTQFEVALACAFLQENTGYIGIEDTLNYDDVTCDGYCLRDELMRSFSLEEEDVRYVIEDEIED